MNTRAAAADVLVQVVGSGRNLTLALDAVLPAIPKDQDRAFVQALSYGVLRWYFRLERVLAALTRKPIKDLDVRMLALLGLYQLKYMRVKPHAAVAETVAAAGAKTWAKPLVNGILRSYQREQARLDAQTDADDAIRFGFPAWLAAALRDDWPEHWRDILDRSNAAPPFSLRINRQRETRTGYIAALQHAGIPARPSDIAETAVVVEAPVPVERLPGFAAGVVSVQDVAAQLAAPLLDLQPGLRVLDVCAAPGGKTVHILETCPDLREVVALDVVAERAAKIRDNLDRGGFRAEVVTADATLPETWWDGRVFDRILVDAPCSATGVIRRHPDIKLLRKPENLAELMELQRLILEVAWLLLAPGGVLVYATCSLLRSENEQRIAEFLSTHPDAAETPIAAEWGRPVSHGRQILTGESDMDGFFYARMEKLRPCAAQ